MPDRLPYDPEAEARQRRAFRWSLAVCAGVPIVASSVGGAGGAWDAPYGPFVLINVVFLWVGVFLLGVLLAAFDRASGVGVALGALGGAVVGFGGCTAVLFALSG